MKHESKRGKKLLSYLRQLSPKERQEFKTYLESPLLGNSLQCAAFLKMLEQQGLLSRHSTIGQDLLLRFFNATELTREKQLNYCWSRLSQFQDKLMDFLVFKEVQTNASKRSELLLAAFKSRSWDSHLLPQYQKAKEQAIANALPARLLHQLNLADAVEHLFVAAPSHALKAEQSAAEAALDGLYFLKKLKLACADHLTGQFSAEPAPDLLYALVMDWANRHLNIYPELEAYVHGYGVLRSVVSHSVPCEHHYTPLERLLLEGKRLDNEFWIPLMIIAQRYCQLQMMKGEARLADNLHALNTAVIARKTWGLDEAYAMEMLGNAIHHLCVQGQVSHANGLLQHKCGIAVPLGASLQYRLLLARIAFAEYRYDKVVSLVSEYLRAAADPQVVIQARLYLCRAYSKLGQYLEMQEHLVALQRHLRRHTGLHATLKEYYLRLTRDYSRLAAILLQVPEKRSGMLQALQRRLAKQPEDALNPWLREEAMGVEAAKRRREMSLPNNVPVWAERADRSYQN